MSDRLRIAPGGAAAPPRRRQPMDRSGPDVPPLRRTAAPPRRSRRSATQSVPVRRGRAASNGSPAKTRRTSAWPPTSRPPTAKAPPTSGPSSTKAQKRFGKALAGDSLMAIAQAFGDIAQAVTDIADALDHERGDQQGQLMIRLLIGLRILRGPRHTSACRGRQAARALRDLLRAHRLRRDPLRRWPRRQPSPIANARASRQFRIPRPLLHAAETRRARRRQSTGSTSASAAKPTSPRSVYKPLSPDIRAK